jgi:hypothetical protein
MFAHVLEVAVGVPRELPTHRFLRARFISFVHRLVEGLQVGKVLVQQVKGIMKNM